MKSYSDNMEANRRKNVHGSGKKFVERHKQMQQKSEKFKKHLGSSAEGQGFADKKKKKIKYEYLKLLKKEKLKQGKSAPGQDNSQTHRETQLFRNKSKDKKGQHSFTKLVHKQKKQKQQAVKQKQEAEVRHQEKESAKQQSKKKRKQNYKLLLKKTSRGQPVMKNQMEFLLAKIERQMNQT